MSLPTHCIHLSEDIRNKLQDLARENKKEVGGYIEKDGNVVIDRGLYSTHNTFHPTDRHKRDVIHFHTHPAKFETPPSDHDFLQTCLDYEFRKDALPYHIVACPASLYILTIPTRIRKGLDSVNSTRKQAVHAEIRDISKKMRKYHVCYGSEKDETCIKRFLNEMKKQFGIKIEWIKNNKDNKNKDKDTKNKDTKNKDTKNKDTKNKNKTNYYSLGKWYLKNFQLCKLLISKQ